VQETTRRRKSDTEKFVKNTTTTAHVDLWEDGLIQQPSNKPTMDIRKRQVRERQSLHNQHISIHEHIMMS
jgi:hypothetical protein